MIKLSSPETARVPGARLLLTSIVSLTLLLESAQLGVAQTSSGQATITTANCSVAGGLCQSGDPSTCNNGQGPNNGAGTGNCPPCNNGSGPNPANIQATVRVCEARVANAVGILLEAHGTGTGFQFGKTYVSLLYFNGNTATCSRFPAGVAPTLQNLPLADSDFASMHLGFWVVKSDGTATLDVVKEATVTGLSNYHTVSVREMQPPNLVCFNCGLDPAPQLNALRACGPLTVTTGCNPQCKVLCQY